MILTNQANSHIGEKW